jgi:ABC-type transporter Mla maintaining outer membrane lipid asymmetry ATPase subunit MlaF
MQAYGHARKWNQGLVNPVVKIEYSDVTLSLKSNKNVVLDGVSGVYAPGQLSAIMGPSGSGEHLASAIAFD